MRLTLSMVEIKDIYKRALDAVLLENGIDPSMNYVMKEESDACGRVTHLYFEQDNTPDVFGDYPLAEWLNALSNKTQEKK